MLRFVSIFFALCLIARVSCDYISFGYPDVGIQHTDMLYTTGSAVRMTNSSTWLMRLYSNPPGWNGGIAYKKNPIATAHNGFTSRFTYVPTLCQNGYPGDVGGFSFFLTTSNITEMGPISIIDQFALNSLPKVFMAGYSLMFNEFLICNWTNAPGNTYLRNICPRMANLDPPYTCAALNSTSRDAAYEFTVIYDTKTLNIYVNETLKFSQPMKLDPVPYTIGFSANIGSLYNSVFRQEITYWNFTSLDSPAVESFKYDNRVSDAEEVAEQFRFLGSAQLANDDIQLVSSAPYTVGAVLHKGGVPAHRGFQTRFTWTPSDCNSGGNGDGFTFFVSRTLPKIGILSSFGNGLGIAKHDNTLVLGYSAFYEEFRKCKWDIPTVEWETCSIIPQIVTSESLVKCNNYYVVDIHFDGRELKMYFDRELVYYDVSQELEPALYYVGLTASNGNNFFRQGINDWSFNILNYNSGIDFPNVTTAVASQFNVFGNAGFSSTAAFLTSTYPNQTGLIVHHTAFTAHAGFEANFDWMPNAFADSSVHNGITFFLSKSYPSAQQVSASWNNFGLQTLSNTYAVVMPITVTNDFKSHLNYYFCQWKTPNVTVAFLDNCVKVNKTSAVPSGETESFTVKYDGRTLEVFVGTRRVLDVPLSMDWDSYYIGVTGTSYVGLGHKLKSLTFKTIQPNTVKQLFTSFIPGDFSLYSDATMNSVLRLTPAAASAVGAAVHPNKVLAHLGFQVKFSYSAQACSSNGLPSGFTYFLAKNLPADDAVASSIHEGLGIRNVPNIGLMVGYDNQKNYYYVCSWETPKNLNFSRSPQCETFVKTRGLHTCDVNYIYNIVYDGDFLQLFVNGAEMLMLKMKLAPLRYYAGFSGTNPANEYGRQNINNWFYNYNTVPLQEQISFDFAEVEDMVLLGNAQVTDGKLVLTNSSNQAGAVFYPHLVRPNVGFNCSFTFLPVNCDPIYNGADGFTLFFTKQLPDQSAVIASVGDMLGVQQVPDVTMVAYSATHNEFFIANWTTPTTDLLRWIGQNIPNPQPRVECNGVYRFAFIYDNYLRVYINDFLVVSAFVNFDPVGYYVGLSGATGTGWFSQEFGVWRFNSYDLTP